MANKRKTSGHYEISEAQSLFEQSKAIGKPDFRYVALAIGNCPPKPPQWAIEACIAERNETQIQPFSLEKRRTGIILDEVVRVLDENEQSGREPKKMSLRAAIITTIKRIDPEFDPTAPMDDNSIRTIRKAWNREQKEDRVQSQYSLTGYQMTSRIDRVITASIGKEFDMPTDPIVDFWQAENGKK